MLDWRVKIAAKVILSRLPIEYDTWRRLSLFRHGAMDDPAYAVSVVERHLRQSNLEDLAGRTVLELGPGDSVGSATIARAYGATRTYLVDVGPFATTAIAPYQRLSELLRKRGFESPKFAATADITDVLGASGGIYLTEGLASLRSIPDASIAFAWSQAVLEHVRLDEFDVTMRELRRVMHADGVASHRIDFEDHLAGSLNNLRFSHARWESPFLRQSGFYTNRLRPNEVIRICIDAGFAVDRLTTERWDQVPLARRHLTLPYRNLSDDELSIRAIDVVIRPVAEPPVASERASDFQETVSP